MSNLNLKWQTGLTSRLYDQKSDEDRFNQDPFRSLIKESAQNSIDALKLDLPDSTTLLNFGDNFKIDFQIEIIELSGDAKKSWKEAVDYDGSFMNLYKELEKYLKTKPDASGAPMYEKEYEELKKTKALLSGESSIFLINITDRNTTGLTGHDIKSNIEEKSNHYDFHKTNNLNTGTAGGGSWGLGKNSYSYISSLGMFITCTNIENPQEIDVENDSKFRIYGGCLQRPVEKYDLEGPDQVLESNWNFGHIDDNEVLEIDFPKTNYTKSFWNETTLAKKLFIDVLDDESGTTVQIPVVKKNILGKNVELTLENLKNEIQKNCSLWLWPAIESGRIEVTIKTAKIANGYRTEGKFESTTVNPSQQPEVSPFVETFKQALTQEELQDEFDNEQEYFKVSNTIYLPKPSEGEQKHTKGSQEYISNTYLKVFDNIDDLNNREIKEFRNCIAIFRSVGIVIRYAKNDLSISRDDVCFTAITMLGTAESSDNINKLAEIIYRYCENPTHNMIANDRKENKLEKYFDAGKEHFWQKDRIRRELVKPIFNSVQSFFSLKNNNVDDDNDYLKSFFKLNSTPEKKEIKIIKNTKRIEVDEVEVTLIAPTKKNYEIELLRASVSEKEDKGTSVNFLAVSKDNKPWEDIKKDNLEVIKDPKSFKFSMYNKTDKDFSFKIILKLDPISNSGIDVSSLDFKLDHTVPKLIRKRETNA